MKTRRCVDLSDAVLGFSMEEREIGVGVGGGWVGGGLWLVGLGERDGYTYLL